MRSFVAGAMSVQAQLLLSDGSRQMFAPAPAYASPMTQHQAYSSSGYVQLQDGAYPVQYTQPIASVQPVYVEQVEQGASWSDVAMLAIAGAAVGGAIGVYTAKSRGGNAQMADISAFGDIWGFDAKKAIYDQWDPEKPRDYDNFNPFERNDESAQCDTNGCFPGQSRGYKSPNRPDQSWEIMQKERAAMDELAKEAKFNMKGKPGNFARNWQEKLGSPP
jgi:hypothetical protein